MNSSKGKEAVVATDSEESSFETLGSQDSKDESFSKEEEEEEETLAKAQAKGKGKEKVQLEAPQGYVAANAYSHCFYSKEDENLMEGYNKRGFTVETKHGPRHL